MPFEAIRAVLTASGYELRFRESEWIECLLIRERESWIGCGRDRAAALDAALRSACPSGLAQDLLARAIDRAAAAERASDVPAQNEAQEVEPRSGESSPVEQRPNGKAGAVAPGVRREGRGVGPPPLVRRETFVPSRTEPSRAVEELETLGERIRDSREELGLCSPERQRLAMLAWICEARAHTDTFPDDTKIRERVGAISRQLTEIGKTFWPGSVTALQLQMQARDLPRHVLGGPASTWARAAELAERTLRGIEYADERRGFDAYGWADTARTHPRPQDPNELMDALAGTIESFGGSLAHYAVPREAELRPEPDAFRKWVRELRWLRCSDVDPDRWARVAGRLRWWACHREAPLVQAGRELEANYLPEQSWAQELGIQDARASSDNRAPDIAQESASSGCVPRGLLDDVRSAFSGKRMVFVSTRRDPDLQTRLKDALPSATLDWRVAEPKRLEALGEAIQHGEYDVVLGAIGFQSQGTDHLLARACRQAGVKYLRVNRGRPIACLRALARDLYNHA